MQFKQAGWALLILIIGAVIFGLLASKTNPGTMPIVQGAPILAGTETKEGDFLYTEDAPYYTIEARYPAHEPVVEQAVADRIEEFKKNGDFANLTAEDINIQGLGPDRKYALDMEYKTYISPNTVSYAYTIYEDTLGAHPNVYFKTFVFDQNDTQLTIKDILASNSNGLEELSLLVSNDVVAQYKERAQVDDTTGLIYDEGLAPKEDNFSNFVIDRDTLVIQIPPYQVAAYAVGSFEVRIKLTDIQ